MTAEILNMVIERRLSYKVAASGEETAPEPVTAHIGTLLEGLRQSAEGLQKLSSLLVQTLDALELQLMSLEPRVEFWLAQSVDCALTRERTRLAGTVQGSNDGPNAFEASSAAYLGFSKIRERWQLAVRVEAERFDPNTGELLEESLVSESSLKDCGFSIQIAAIQKMPEFLKAYRGRIDALATTIKETAEAVQVSTDNYALQHVNQDVISPVQNGSAG